MKILSLLLVVSMLAGCTYRDEESTERRDIKRIPTSENRVLVEDWDTGYAWAEENDVQSFEECQDRFGTSDAEDWCNEYVQENSYDEEPEFHGYPCTEDCSGHEAGYRWAEENDIDDTDDCDGNSQSFIEGCEAYVEE